MKDDLKKRAREKEEQQPLVSKHMHTEGKLGQQARKLVIVNEEFEQDLDKLYNKLSKVKDTEGDNKDFHLFAVGDRKVRPVEEKLKVVKQLSCNL